MITAEEDIFQAGLRLVGGRRSGGEKLLGTVSITATILEAGGDERIAENVERAVVEGDSIGAILECRTTGLPVGLGEPFFDSVESLLSISFLPFRASGELSSAQACLGKDERFRV